MGTLRLPRTISPRYVDENDVWAVERDEFGVNYLARYRLVTD